MREDRRGTPSDAPSIDRNTRPRMCKRFDGAVKAAMVVFALGIVGGCSADWHLRKAIGKDPSIVLRVQAVDLTLTIPEETFEIRTPASPCPEFGDTTSVKDEKTDASVTIAPTMNEKGDTIYRYVIECPEQEVQQRVDCPPQIRCPEPSWWERFRLAVPFMFTAGFLGVVVGAYVRGK